MNSLCLSTLSSTSSLLVSSPHSFSPLFSLFRGSQSALIHSWKRINTTQINRPLLLSSYSTTTKIRQHNNYPFSSQIINRTNPLFRVGGLYNNNNYNNKYNSKYNYIEKRTFHATRPLYAAHGTFRLASFFAPILMRHVRTWIGTPSTNSKFFRRLVTVIALLFGIPGIYIYTHLESTPYTNRVRFVALTSSDEADIAEMAFDELVEQHEADFIPDHHHFVTKVTEVAERIIIAADRPDIKWEVRIVDSPVANAFAIPGGKVFVFSGLLKVTENDDGLAFILGHEVAHVLARHGAEQMTIARVMLGFSVFLSAIFGDNVGSFGVSWVIRLLTELKYSRNMEREADYIGLLLMQKAKYNIEEAPRVWERMVQATGDGGQMPFLSTHPSHGERITDISKWVQELKLEQKLLTA